MRMGGNTGWAVPPRRGWFERLLQRMGIFGTAEDDRRLSEADRSQLDDWDRRR